MKHQARLRPENKGLPANIDAERLILGSILLDGRRFAEVADVIRRDDFVLEKHRRIFARMMELAERGEAIDRVTVANELLRYNELESVDGLSYLVSLDDGLPMLPNIDGFFKIIREKGALRRIAYIAEYALNRALLAQDEPAAILSSLSEQVEELGTGLALKQSRVEDLPGVGDIETPVRYLRQPELPEGAVIALTGDSGSGKSTLATAWARDVIASGRPVLLLDRESPRSVAFDRMQRLRLEDSPLLRWAGGWTGDVPGPESAAAVKWVRDSEPKPLIIVDSLAAFIAGDENNASDMRRFTHQLRRLADLGATVVAIHHDGKSDSARDFRGSSDFKASFDQCFHLTNTGPDMQLDRIRLRCFKSRYGFAGDIVYRYAAGRFVRDEDQHAPARTVTDQLRSLLRMNPGVSGSEFEQLAFAEGIAQKRVRDFLGDGVLEGSIQRTPGYKNTKKYEWIRGTE